MIAKKGCLIVCLSIILICIIVLIIGIGKFVYATQYERKLVVTSNAPDTEYELKIYQKGTPDWPFGSAHCFFELYKGEEKITKYYFSISDDGGGADIRHFNITWNIDNVTIIVSASEQKDVTYTLYFDGTSSQTEK